MRVTIRSDRKIVAEQPPDGPLPAHRLRLDPLRLRTIEVLVDLLRQNRLENPKELQVLGANLYDVLFDNEIGRMITEALLSEETGLMRVELVFERGSGVPARLATWPWEYLYCPEWKHGEEGSGYFLAEKSRLILSRQLRLRHPRELRIKQSELPLKIAFVAAGPRQDLDDEEYKLLEAGPIEYQGLLDEIAGLKKEGLIEVRQFVEDSAPGADYKVSFRAFTDFIRSMEPHVIHFLGHGRCTQGGGSLLFMEGPGRPQWVADRDFASVLSEVFSVRLVFLQACESALPDPYQAVSGVARRLAHNRIPAVVAMQYRIQQRVANGFARTFYRALAEEKPIDQAVQLGRAAIWEDISSWSRRQAFGLPVLYLQKSEALFATATPASVPVAPEIPKPTGQPVQQSGPSAPAPGPALSPAGDAFAFATGASLPIVRACPWCRSPQESAEAMVCDQCGGDLRCGNCKTLVPRKGAFCTVCRARLTEGQPIESRGSLSPLGAQLTASRAPSEGPWPPPPPIQ